MQCFLQKLQFCFQPVREDDFSEFNHSLNWFLTAVTPKQTHFRLNHFFFLLNLNQAASTELRYWCESRTCFCVRDRVMNSYCSSLTNHVCPGWVALVKKDFKTENVCRWWTLFSFLWPDESRERQSSSYMSPLGVSVCEKQKQPTFKAPFTNRNSSNQIDFIIFTTFTTRYLINKEEGINFTLDLDIKTSEEEFIPNWCGC